jgi:arylsulfatase
MIIHQKPPLSEERPNIVLICVDQWRGDCLSVAGHPVVQTPFIDQLALDGVRFSKAYSATPTCVAARASLHTGLSQRSHGRVGYKDGISWDYPCTMADEFTNHGYQTQAVGKMHVYPERSQIGFQNVILHDGFLHISRNRYGSYSTDDYLPWLRQSAQGNPDYFDHGVNCNSYIARPWDKAEHLHPTNFVVTQSIDFLRRRDPRKPFFLFMSFRAPHPPYDPPAWALDQYLNQPMPAVPVGDWVDLFADLADPRRPSCQFGEVDPRTLQRARAGYYGSMTHIDHQINRFVESLREFQLHTNTYICFVSDHGEMMGDHHFFQKAIPYEGSSRIPLILKGPDSSGIKRGCCHDEIVELRDVMPTLLDCAGLPIPESVEGKSFLSITRGERGVWRNCLHGEHVVRKQSMHWIRSQRTKYIWFSGSGTEQLFDLSKDPNELHDLAEDSSYTTALEDSRRALIHELTGREEGFTDGKLLISGRPIRACLENSRTSEILVK